MRRALAALVAALALAGAGLAQPQDADARVRELGAEIRCPVCRGLPIGESPSEFARTMVNELRAQVAQNRSDDEIRAYFVSRYGADVLLDPPKRGINLVVWLGPVVAVLLGGLGLVAYLRRASAPPQPAAVSAEALERGPGDLEARNAATTKENKT